MKGCQSHLSGIVCKTTLGKSPVVGLAWEGCVWVCGPALWEWLPWVSWSSDLHHEGVWPCSKALKTKQTERFSWCQQIKVLCQIQHTRREWRLNGDFSNSRLFETCSLELILLRGMSLCCQAQCSYSMRQKTQKSQGYVLSYYKLANVSDLRWPQANLHQMRMQSMAVKLWGVVSRHEHHFL